VDVAEAQWSGIIMNLVCGLYDPNFFVSGDIFGFKYSVSLLLTWQQEVASCPILYTRFFPPFSWQLVVYLCFGWQIIPMWFVILGSASALAQNLFKTGILTSDNVPHAHTSPLAMWSQFGVMFGLAIGGCDLDQHFA
jgi:hypothetical protein